MYHKTILKNGLKAIIHNMPRMQSAALGIWIKVGGRYEGSNLKGISHFMEHLAFKGTKKYSCRKIKESIEGVGGSLNGFTSEEVTCYLAKFPAGYLDLVFDILSDMVVSPNLLEAEVNKEKTVIIEEIKMYKDLPQAFVYELLDELLWPNQPLGMPISGSVESVAAIKQEDLSLFKDSYYAAQNIVISVAGLIDEPKFMKRLEKKFCGLQGMSPSVFDKVKEKQDKPQLKLLAKDTEQTHLALGFHGFRRDHSLKYASGLLHIILGANMSSRLFNELREKRGLAYEIGTQVKRFYDTGAFIVHAGIDNRKVQECLGIILKELRRARENLVTEDEFRRAREFYIGQLMLALEDTLDHMLWIGESTVALDRTYTLEEVIREVNKVSRKDIRQAGEYLFRNDKLNLALIGPLSKESQTQIYNQLSLD